MNQKIIKQLALDYCCSEEAVQDKANHFTEYVPLGGRRMFEESADGCFLKIAVFGGKLLVTGQKDMVAALEEKFGDMGGEWFMDAAALSCIDRMIGVYGWRIEQVHEFYTSDQKKLLSTEGFELRWYERDEIVQFKGDERFAEAFAFDENAPDVLGVAAFKDDRIMGMAGASADSPLLWQIGVNIMEDCEKKGIGSMLVTALKNEVLDRGFLPYYGTAMSHLASKRVALKAGFLPAWVELITSKGAASPYEK